MREILNSLKYGGRVKPAVSELNPSNQSDYGLLNWC